MAALWLKTVDTVQRAAGEWQKKALGTAWLVHSGERLTSGEALLQRPDFERLLGAGGLAYLRACRERDDGARAERESQSKQIAQEQARVKEEQARTGRAQRRILALLVAVAVILVCGGVWIVARSREVGRQVSLVLAAAAAKANDEGHYTSAMRIAIVAARDGWLNPAVPEAEAEISRGAQSSVMIAEAKHNGGVYSASFSPDGRQVLTASEDDRTARIWDAQTGQTVVMMKLDDTVWGAAFSPNGRWVVTTSDDKTARIWDAVSGRTLVQVKHDDFVRSASFSPDGGRVVTATDGGTARVWDAESGKTIAEVKQGSFVMTAIF